MYNIQLNNLYNIIGFATQTNIRCCFRNVDFLVNKTFSFLYKHFRFWMKREIIGFTMMFLLFIFIVCVFVNNFDQKDNHKSYRLVKVVQLVHFW
jgi:hypothetical protein